MALFNKKNKGKEKIKDPERGGEVAQEELKEGASDLQGGSQAFSGAGGSNTHRILTGFYVSEKSSLGNQADQYTFRVFKSANKSEVKKEVSKLFNVKVKNVKILNMPEKRRDFGRHPGEKSGFKKAIVTLEKGQVIGQAKP